MRNFLCIIAFIFLLASIQAQKTEKAEIKSQNPLNNSEGAVRKKIAVIISEYRPGSHADAIISKLFDGYYYGVKDVNPVFR